MSKTNLLVYVVVLLSFLLFFAGCSDEIDKPSKNTGKSAEMNTLTGKDGAPMVLIPAGEFQMGDSFNEGYVNEHPVHTVYLDAFYMDIYEVTNAQYKKFVQATGYKEPEGINAPKPWSDPNFNGDNYPVVGVSWEDAYAYASWAGERLPTEAEWEKAARGGLVGKRYPWGDVITHDEANYEGTGGKDQWVHTSPVGSFAPNGYGLYDMAGNVWEWCADWYNNGYYSDSPWQNPKGPDSGTSKIFRGGSCGNPDYYLRTASRYDYYPTYGQDNNVGFRCVR